MTCNWGEGPDPPEIFLDVEQIFNNKRGPGRHPRLEKIGYPPPRPKSIRNVP